MTETAADFAPPRAALIGAGLLAVLAFGAALLGRADIGAAKVPDSVVVQSRALKILSDRVGSATVYDAASGGLIVKTEPGDVANGFVWGALNGLSYGRKQAGGALDAPYDLSLREDGRLTLTDSLTGQRIMLTSFGSDNAAAFARLLDAPTVDQLAEAHR